MTEESQSERHSDKPAKKGAEKLPKPVMEKPAKPVLEKTSKAAMKPAPTDSFARQGSDKSNKSPPPPPPRKTYSSLSSGMTTTRSGEVVYTSRKDSVSAQVSGVKVLVSQGNVVRQQLLLVFSLKKEEEILHQLSEWCSDSWVFVYFISWLNISFCFLYMTVSTSLNLMLQLTLTFKKKVVTFFHQFLKDGEEEVLPPTPQPKPAKVPPETKPKPATPPPVTASVTNEEEDEGDKIMAELQVRCTCTLKCFNKHPLKHTLLMGIWRCLHSALWEWDAFLWWLTPSQVAKGTVGTDSWQKVGFIVLW